MPFPSFYPAGLTKGYTQLEDAGCQPGLRAAEWTKERSGGRGTGGGCFFLLLKKFFLVNLKLKEVLSMFVGGRHRNYVFHCVCVYRYKTIDNLIHNSNELLEGIVITEN